MLKASVFNGFNGSNESNGMNGSNGSNKGLNNSIVVVDSELSFCNSYQLAIKNYLNKNFHHSWNLILPLINEVLQGRKLIGNRDLAIGCFKLYFSLVDLFLKKPELFNLPRSERVIIEKEFKNGLLVNQLLVISGNDYGKIDSELFFIASLIEFGNEFEITKLELQLENYLRSNDYLTSGGFENDNKNLRKILSLYLFKVLPKNHNFEKSQELIEKIYIRDDIKISQKLAKLKQVKTNLQKIEEANKMEKVKKEAERQRLAKKKKEEEEEEKEKEKKTRQLTTIKEVQHQQPQRQPQKSAPAHSKETTTLFLLKNLRKILLTFKTKKILLYLFMLISLLLSLRKYKKTTGKIAQMVTNTLSMAFKVSYL